VSRDSRLHVLELRSVWGTGGGPEKTILHGAALANRDEVTVTVSYIRDQRDQIFALDQRAVDLGVDYYEISERHSFDAAVWRQLCEVVRARHIDIVHSHDYKTDFFAWLLSRRLGIVPISTVHGWSGYTLRERALYYPVGKRLLARFPRVIAVSSLIKEELVRCGTRPERVEVILNAIDSAVFRSDPAARESVRRELGFGGDHFVIGAVGRLEREKRFDILIDAFALVRQRHPTARLVFVGDGSLRADLSARASQLGVSDACLILGHRGDAPSLYQAFDVFVQSSETEGTPNAVLEAMATERPIVATDVGGTRELARPDVEALIVPKHDAPALANGIDRIKADPAAAEARTRAARARVESDLSFPARTRRLEKLYDELVSDRRT
jgi:glycosyltransferase involved in cell wall biosynthesis